MSPDEAQAIEAEVRQAFQGLVEAARSLETAPYLAYLARDGFTAQLDGTVYSSYEAFSAMYAEQLPSIEAFLSLEFDNVQVSVLNRTTAVLVNEFTETIVLASGNTLNLAGGGGQVWTRVDADWKLIHISGSTRPQA
ncbi:MAG: nuclear transport factor 2 family protein [Bacteroidota bacterium]